MSTLCHKKCKEMVPFIFMSLLIAISCFTLNKLKKLTKFLHNNTFQIQRKSFYKNDSIGVNLVYNGCVQTTCYVSSSHMLFAVVKFYSNKRQQSCIKLIILKVKASYYINPIQDGLFLGCSQVGGEGVFLAPPA